MPQGYNVFPCVCFAYIWQQQLKGNHIVILLAQELTFIHLVWELRPSVFWLDSGLTYFPWHCAALFLLWIWFLGLPFSKCELLCPIKKLMKLFATMINVCEKLRRDLWEGIISLKFCCLWKAKFSYWNLKLGNSALSGLKFN